MPKVAEKVAAVSLADLEHKPLLSINEASALTGIGQNKIEKMLKEPNCNFLLNNGTKRMVKKDLFLAYLMSQTTI